MNTQLFLAIFTLLQLSPAAIPQCELQKLTPSSPEAALYGRSVALFGGFAVVGAPFDDTFALVGGAA
jgi:hypothetical protein